MASIPPPVPFAKYPQGCLSKSGVSVGNGCGAGCDAGLAWTNTDYRANTVTCMAGGQWQFNPGGKFGCPDPGAAELPGWVYCLVNHPQWLHTYMLQTVVKACHWV